MHRLVLLAFALLAACSRADGDEPTEDAVAAEPATASLFASEIAPLLAANCATCHLTGTEAGSVALIPARAVEQTVNVPSVEAPTLMRVKPGDPDASYLVMKLEGTHVEQGGTGARMPFGAPPLSPEKTALVRRWIAEGADR